MDWTRGNNGKRQRERVLGMKGRRRRRRPRLRIDDCVKRDLAGVKGEIEEWRGGDCGWRWLWNWISEEEEEEEEGMQIGIGASLTDFRDTEKIINNISVSLVAHFT